MQLTVKITHAELVRQGLENLSEVTPQIGRQKIYDGLLRAKQKIVTYPGAPPGSKYARTGTYRRSFSIEAFSAGWRLHGEAVNPYGRVYTPFVGGTAFGSGQAAIHAGRWPLIRDEVEVELVKLPQTIREAVLIVARRDL